MKIHFFCIEVIQGSSNDPPPGEEKNARKNNHKPNKPKAAVLGIRYSIVFHQRVITGAQ